LAVEKRDQLFVGLERPVSLATFRLFQRLSEAGIDDPALGGRIFTVNNKFWGENDLASFCVGFHQVAIDQAQLDTKPSGNGHLALALHSNDGAHGDQFPEAGNLDFLKCKGSGLLKSCQGQRFRQKSQIQKSGSDEFGSALLQSLPYLGGIGDVRGPEH
jgi:hypothetical protein